MTTTSISGASVVRQAERTASRVIDGKAVVVVIDHQRLHTLNPVATRIWELADGRTLGEIVDRIVQEFEVTREDAERDAIALIDELARLGAVELA
jgi:hypothetical protein